MQRSVDVIVELKLYVKYVPNTYNMFYEILSHFLIINEITESNIYIYIRVHD